jgi:SAM-dependent methyltransferase
LRRVSGALRRLRRVWDEGASDAQMHHEGYLRWRERVRNEGFETLDGIRLLDVGCGDRAPFSLLAASEGARVTAIDLLPVELSRRRPLMWLRLLRARGPAAALRQAVRDALHTWRYHRTLARASGRRLDPERIDLRVMNAESLDFPNDSFELVVSSAVWEHLHDVRSATREVQRVLRPGGIAYIQVAMFPSLQGGHHAEWHDTSPGVVRTIRPWDHIREDGRPLPLYCNGWREDQYREVFETEATILDWEPGESRGAEYLTPELRAELATYSERDLLLPFVNVWVVGR